MIIEQDLKDQLQTIADNNFSISNEVKPFDLALMMLDHIGSTDSYLRDNLIYTSFATWILDHHLFSHDELNQLLSIVLDEKHLFYRIGETNTHSVFTRSFSVLLLPLLLIENRTSAFLSEAAIQSIKSKLLQYIHDEQDLRGYTEAYGWAHAVAHMADAFDDLAQCSALDAHDLQAILQAISTKICVGTTYYIHEEDERMVTAVMSIINRNILTEHDLAEWITGFDIQLQQSDQNPLNYTYFNTKQFLRSLYFRLQPKNGQEKTVQVINQLLNKISHFKD
ncbi:MAG: DUF2785 domain-containing protein [Chloroflexi bacterium]|nr:DUF2785 domain-containing protein [Chloroflexota bacterium]